MTFASTLAMAIMAILLFKSVGGLIVGIVIGLLIAVMIQQAFHRINRAFWV